MRSNNTELLISSEQLNGKSRRNVNGREDELLMYDQPGTFPLWATPSLSLVHLLPSSWDTVLAQGSSTSVTTRNSAERQPKTAKNTLIKQGLSK